MKVLPNVRQFNPADPQNKSFYRALTLWKLLFRDYPLSVFHVAAWGRVAFGALRNIIRTKNRFDRQVAVCRGLKIGFRSLGDLLPQPIAQTMP